MRRETWPSESVAATSNFIAGGGSSMPGSAHQPLRAWLKTSGDSPTSSHVVPFQRTDAVATSAAFCDVKFDVGGKGVTDRACGPPTTSGVTCTVIEDWS